MTSTTTLENTELPGEEESRTESRRGFQKYLRRAPIHPSRIAPMPKHSSSSEPLDLDSARAQFLAKNTAVAERALERFSRSKTHVAVPEVFRSEAKVEGRGRGLLPPAPSPVHRGGVGVGPAVVDPGVRRARYGGRPADAVPPPLRRRRAWDRIAANVRYSRVIRAALEYLTTDHPAAPLTDRLLSRLSGVNDLAVVREALAEGVEAEALATTLANLTLPGTLATLRIHAGAALPHHTTLKHFLRAAA